MTPKEKARELFEKYTDYSDSQKQCALIAVEEILGHMGADRGYKFWTEVKQELEKL